MTLMPFAGADKVDLKGKFEELIDMFQGGDLEAFFKVAAWIGAIILAIAIITYFWQRRRGGAGGGGKGGSKAVVLSAIVGGILVAPGALLPLLLGIIDTIINAFINIGGTVFGS